MKIMNYSMLLLLALSLAAPAQKAAPASDAKKAATSATAKAADLVDINSATAERLQALPESVHPMRTRSSRPAISRKE